MAGILAFIILGIYLFRKSTPEQEAAGLEKWVASLCHFFIQKLMVYVLVTWIIENGPNNLYYCKSFGRLNHVLSWLAVVRSVFILSVKLSLDCSVTESPTWNCFYRSTLAFITVLSFLLGALCSGVAGYIGMWVSVRANVRVSSAARRSAREALLVCILDHFYFWECTLSLSLSYSIYI